jgi:DNA-binding FrmR family transcriptional regulator
MAHVLKEKAKLIARVRRIRGQLEAAERALDQDSGCSELLQLLAAARGAMNGLMAQVLEEHLYAHVASPTLKEGERAKGTQELIEVMRTYLK